MTIAVRKDHFSGTSKVFSREPDALAAILRGMAIDNAITRVATLSPAAFTDSSTGTASDPYAVVNPPIAPSGVFNATAAGGVLASAFNTSLGKIANAHAVMAGKMNPVLAALGIPQITYISGTVASAGVIPAQDLTATTGAGVLAVNLASYTNGCAIVASNQRIVALLMGRILDALGGPAGYSEAVNPLQIGFETPNNPANPASSFTPNTSATHNAQVYAMQATPTVAVDASGANSVLLADGTAFLAAMANNFATLAKVWANAVVGATLSSITDNSTGTVALEQVAALGTVTPYTTAGTDLAPKAGFDTQLALYANVQASFASRINAIANDNGIGALLTDNTGGTASTTLAAMSSSLTAVTGSGNTGVAAATALTSWTAVKNNMATLIAAVNKLAPTFDVTPLIDNTGGVASPGTPAFVDEAGLSEVPMESVAAVLPVLVVVSATGTGVTGAALNSQANTEADADLAAGMNAVATLAAALNKMVGNTPAARPLHVVAR